MRANSWARSEKTRLQRLERAVENVVDVEKRGGVGLEIRGDREGHQLAVGRERDIAAVPEGVRVLESLQRRLRERASRRPTLMLRRSQRQTVLSMAREVKTWPDGWRRRSTTWLLCVVKFEDTARERRLRSS